MLCMNICTLKLRIFKIVYRFLLSKKIKRHKYVVLKEIRGSKMPLEKL